MTCAECASVQKQFAIVHRECKFWKDRYYIEKKCRNSLIHWILGVFGFTVKVEFEKDSQGIKIEGKEHKEAITQAAIPTAGNELKVMMMEDRVNPEDFLEDSEEVSSLALYLSEMQGEGHTHNISETHTTTVQLRNEIQPETIMESNQQQQLELGGDTENQDAQVIWDMLRNYENSALQPSYIILKTEGNETIPLQLDYSQFANGDVASFRRNPIVLTDNNQVLYRLAATPSGGGNAGSANILTQTTATNPQQSISGKATKPQKSTVSKRLKLLGPNSNLAPKTSSTTAARENKTGDKFAIEFGLTLREKAEVYVQTKATEAIRKLTQGQGFVCSLCSTNYIFSSVENALIHTKTHFEGKPYACGWCDEVFSIQKDFLQHKKLHLPKKLPSKSHSPVKYSTVLPTKSPVFVSPAPQISNTHTLPTIISSEGNLISNPNSYHVIDQPGPGPGNKNKPFKCQVSGCEWSYTTENELGWHLKAHLQSRV